jgi:hypothetical protein
MVLNAGPGFEFWVLSFEFCVLRFASNACLERLITQRSRTARSFRNGYGGDPPRRLGETSRNSKPKTQNSNLKTIDCVLPDLL